MSPLSSLLLAELLHLRTTVGARSTTLKDPQRTDWRAKDGTNPECETVQGLLPPSPKSQLSANFEFLLLNTAPCAPVSSDLAPSLFASTLSGISQTALHPSPCITHTHRSRVSHFYHPPTLSEMHSERNSSLAKERHLRWQHINVNMLHCSVWISVQHAQHIDKTSSGL